LSEEHKRKFTITAGILGAIFFIAQFILPPILMMAAMPVMMFSQDSWMKEANPERGTFWNNQLWYVETALTTETSASGQTTLKRLPVDSEGGPETVVDLPIKNPWLLTGKDRVWIISSSAVGFYRNGNIKIVSQEKTLGDISRPFLYRGYPAVVEERPTGLTVMVFIGNRWQKEFSFGVNVQETRGRIYNKVQVLTYKGTLHLFLKFGDTLYYREGPPPAPIDDRDLWQPVTEVGYTWFAALINDEPVVFHYSMQDTHAKIVGLKKLGNAWKPFFAYDAIMTTDMGIYPLGQPGRFAMLLQSFPGSLRLVQVEGTKVVSEIRHGWGFPFPPGFMAMMFIPYGFMLVLPLILAIILSGMMRRHRVCEYESQPFRVPFASLTRRAFAQIIDAAILAGPTVVGFLIMMPGFFDVEKMLDQSPFGMLAGFGLMLVGLLWVIVCLFIFSFLEGKWGGTPGKWALGIRVFGTDLNPCGFGRALVRNLLKFVDGFFNFMVGVMLVALTEEWQRVGDLAARTIVINMRKEKTLLLQGNEVTPIATQ
jgi:uncharacterized RDD family membrane protein YckC